MKYTIKDIEEYNKANNKWIVTRITSQEQYDKLKAHFPRLTSGKNVTNAYYLTATNNSGFSEVVGAYEIQNYTKIEFSDIDFAEQELVGYKPPHPLFDGVITSDKHIYKPLSSGKVTSYAAIILATDGITPSKYNLPAEIVEKWEPIYKTLYKVGDWITVTIVPENSWLNDTGQRTFQLTNEPTLFNDGSHWSTSGPDNSHNVGETGYGIKEYHFRKATEEEINKATSVLLTLGSKNAEVIVTKGRITCRGQEVKVSSLENLIRKFTNQLDAATSEWGIKLIDAKFLVGCKQEDNQFTLDEIKQVVETYQKLQR